MPVRRDLPVFDPETDPRLQKVRGLYGEIIAELRLLRDRELISPRFLLCENAILEAKRAEALAAKAIAWRL